MVKSVEEGSTRVFYCEVCGYGYGDRGTAEECQKFCTKNNACSLIITRKAIRKPTL